MGERVGKSLVNESFLLLIDSAKENAIINITNTYY